MRHLAKVDAIPEALFSGWIGSKESGTAIIFYLRLRKDFLLETSYNVYGCSATIASAEILSRLTTGRSPEDAVLLVKPEIIVDRLEIKLDKYHSVILCCMAIRSAMKKLILHHSLQIELPRLESFSLILL